MGLEPKLRSREEYADKAAFDMMLMNLDKQIADYGKSMANKRYNHEDFRQMQRMRRYRDELAYNSPWYGADPGNRRFNQIKEQQRLGALADQRNAELTAQQNRRYGGA